MLINKMGRVTNKLLATKQYKKTRTLNIYTLVILTQATKKTMSRICLVVFRYVIGVIFIIYLSIFIVFFFYYISTIF